MAADSVPSLEFEHEMEPRSLYKALNFLKFESDAPFEPSPEGVFSPFTSSVLRRLARQLSSDAGAWTIDRHSEQATRVVELLAHRLDDPTWWHRLDVAAKRSHVRDLASPFDLEDALVDELIALAEGEAAPGSALRLHIHSALVLEHGVPGGGWIPGGTGSVWWPIEEFAPEDPRRVRVEVLAQLEDEAGERMGALNVIVQSIDLVGPGWSPRCLVVDEWSSGVVLKALDDLLASTASPSRHVVMTT